MTTAKNNRTKKIFARIGFGMLGLLLILLIIIGVVLNTIVTPKRITPVVVNVAQQYLNAEFNCESIDISFFGTFPDFGIKMNNGSIIHKTPTDTDSILQPAAQDTLLTFQSATISLNPAAFLFNKKIIIHKFEIENADIYAFVNAEGKANWDIMPEADKVKEENKADDPFEIPEFNIKDIRFRNINLTYDDLQEDIYLAMDSIRMRLDGNMSKAQANLNFSFRTSGITSYYQGQTYSRGLPFSIRTRLNSNCSTKLLAVDRAAVNVGILKFKAEGNIQQSDTAQTANVDIDFTLNASSLSDVMEMIPEHFATINSEITAKGAIESQGKLSGQIGPDKYPLLSLSVQLTDGAVSPKKQPGKPFVEKVNANFSTFLDLSEEQPSTFKLTNFSARSHASKIEVKGSFDHLLTRPSIDAQAKADIDFTQLSQAFSFQEEMKMGGMINFDLSAKCLLDDVLNSNLGKIDVNGSANVQKLFFSHLKDNFSLYATQASMEFGSNTQDSIRGRVRESLLKGNMTLDSLSFRWKDEMNVNAGKVSARFSTSEAKGTNAIAPVTTSARAENLRLTMGDSVRLRAFKTSASIRILPSAENQHLPQINMRFSLDSLRGRYVTTGTSVQNANLALKINKIQSRTRTQRRQADGDTVHTTSRRDTTAVRRQYAGMTRAQRDSLRQIQLNPETNISFQLESREARDLLRKWNVSGSFSSKNMNVRTPGFPIPIRARESELNFTTDSLKVKKADMRIGTSSFNLTGEISGIRRALLTNDKVAARFTLAGDSIDFNQLIKAAVAGSEYSLKSASEKDSISTIVLDEAQAIPVDIDTIQSGIFVIPRNLDIEFNSRIKNARIGNMHIRNARGSIILRDQAVQLPRFRLNSDIGEASMTMVYKAANNRGAHLGMDVKISRMDIKQLTSSLPFIDELAPMLRSFEGVVDCEMAAVTELDSVMNVIFPETTASCHLQGKNMVLLDGETFSEIAKTMRFKNKKRNLIDSISVEMVLEDEKLMIFPFQISMDRYSAAVGGVQNLDLSFNYHITVLKSPLPFKLGLNITGDIDNMKIRLAKAKYKDYFTTAREEEVSGTVLNVRQEMDEKLRKSIQEIIGSDLRRPVRRPKVVLPDSLKQEFFQLDTTAVEQSLQDSLLAVPAE